MKPDKQTKHSTIHSATFFHLTKKKKINVDTRSQNEYTFQSELGVPEDNFVNNLVESQFYGSKDALFIAICLVPKIVPDLQQVLNNY